MVIVFVFRDLDQPFTICIYIYTHTYSVYIYIYICDSAILLVLYVIFPLFLVGTSIHCTATRLSVFSSSFKAHLLKAHEDLIIAMRRLQKCRGYDQLSSGC